MEYIIYYGMDCLDRSDCKYGKKCKYRYSKFHWKIHNFKVSIRRFFQYRLHIKLPMHKPSVIFTRYTIKLSGTSKCPHNLPRNYTCYDCTHICGRFLDLCNSKERVNDFHKRNNGVETEYWGYRCKYLDKIPGSDEYKYEDKYFEGYKLINRL